MKKVGAPPSMRLERMGKNLSVEHFAKASATSLHQISESAGVLFKFLEKDQRLLRIKLLTEELGELLGAISSQDDVEALDALADLQFVVEGTAIQFDLNLPAAFKEVCRSNMTKGVAAAEHDSSGDKGKGDDFSPPDIASLV